MIDNNMLIDYHLKYYKILLQLFDYALKSYQ